MESNIGVGVIVGLALTSSIYVWNNDKFSSVQKTILLICIIFPPAQWLGILLVSMYNSNTENKTPERKAEKKLDSTISNLTELKEKGILTEEEYKTKVDKIEVEKTEQNLKNSLEYKQLKSLFDNGILTKEEFESKIQLLQNVSEKSADIKEVSEILDSTNNTYTDSTEEKNTNFTSLYIIIAVCILSIGGIVLYSNNNSNNSEDVYIPPAIDTSAVYKTDYQEPLKDKIDSTTTVKEVEKLQSISLFSDVCGIYLGESSFNDVKLILGEPDFIDITKVELDKHTGGFIGGNKIVKYKKLGIEILFEREDTQMSAVGNISVKRNFTAKSAEGLYIGMPEDECCKILDSKYFKDLEIDDDYKSYLKKEGGTKGLSVLFKDKKLDKLTMY